LLEYQKRRLLGKFPLSRKKTFEGASIAVLVNKVKIIGCFKHVEIAYNMLISFNVGEDINFVDSALFQFFIFPELGDGYDFDGILFFIVIVDGAIDLAVDS
jgi:hypothetical protein